MSDGVRVAGVTVRVIGLLAAGLAVASGPWWLWVKGSSLRPAPSPSSVAVRSNRRRP